MKSTYLILLLICSVSMLTAHEPVKKSLNTGTLSGKIESQGDLVPFEFQQMPMDISTLRIYQVAIMSLFFRLSDIVHTVERSS